MLLGKGCNFYLSHQRLMWASHLLDETSVSSGMLNYHKHLFKVFRETNPNPGRGPGALADSQAKLLCIHK